MHLIKDSEWRWYSFFLTLFGISDLFANLSFIFKMYNFFLYLYYNICRQKKYHNWNSINSLKKYLYSLPGSNMEPLCLFEVSAIESFVDLLHQSISICQVQFQFQFQTYFLLKIQSHKFTSWKWPLQKKNNVNTVLYAKFAGAQFICKVYVNYIMLWTLWSPLAAMHLWKTIFLTKFVVFVLFLIQNSYYLFKKILTVYWLKNHKLSTWSRQQRKLGNRSYLFA